MSKSSGASACEWLRRHRDGVVDENVEARPRREECANTRRYRPCRMRRARPNVSSPREFVFKVLQARFVATVDDHMRAGLAQSATSSRGPDGRRRRKRRPYVRQGETIVTICAMHRHDVCGHCAGSRSCAGTRGDALLDRRTILPATAAAARTGADCRRVDLRFPCRRRRRRSSPARAHRRGTDRRRCGGQIRARARQCAAISAAASTPSIVRPHRSDRPQREALQEHAARMHRYLRARRMRSITPASRQRQSRRLNGSWMCRTSAQSSAASASSRRLHGNAERQHRAVFQQFDQPLPHRAAESGHVRGAMQQQAIDAVRGAAHASDAAMLRIHRRAHFAARRIGRKFVKRTEFGDGANGLARCAALRRGDPRCRHRRARYRSS